MPRSKAPWHGSFEPCPRLEDFKPYEELKPGECAPSYSTEVGVGTNALGLSSVNPAKGPATSVDCRPKPVDPIRGGLVVKRACIYARVSTNEQGDGTSLDSQVLGSRQYCDRQGHYINRIFRETLSGRDDDRPAFQKILHLARLGRFDVLVVWRRDRYFRNAIEAGFWERRLKEWGVRIEDVQRGPQDDSPANRFTTTIIDAVAELERENIAERCALGRLMAARAGLWPVRALYGYRKEVPREASRLVIDLEEALKVREAYRACIRGANRDTLGQIFGIAGASATRRLRSPVYKGQAVYGGVTVPCPAIVTPETWQEAQDAMDLRFRNVDMYGRLIHAAIPSASRSPGTAS